ncbi:MAG: hypothetical protein WKG00_33265 [Polyangiaceae bacterium]
MNPQRLLSHACALAAALLVVSAASAGDDARSLDGPTGDMGSEASGTTEGATETEGEPALAAVAPDGPGAATAEGSGQGGAKKHRTPPKPRRGGVNPCMTPDPGWGKYDKWKNVAIGQMVAPHKGGLTKSGGFDLLVHFHGHEPIRKEFIKSADGMVLVGIDLGIGSGAYQNVFAAPTAWKNLVASVEATMSKKSGQKAHVRKIALSSWSAGYGAIEQILRQPAGNDIDALVLLDSVHAGYIDEQKGTLKEDQLQPFVDFARRAAKKERFMFLSHSSIQPPGYASTRETAAFIVGELNGKTRKATRLDVLGLDMFTRFDRGDFHVRGYTGDDKPDHCAHIGLMTSVLKVHLQPRFKTPRAR